MGLLDRVKRAQQQAAGAVAGAGATSGQLASRLGARGVEAPGVINTIRPTGETDMGGGQKQQVDVTIAPSGGPPYETTITQAFLPAQLDGLGPGGAIRVKYDPDNPASALIYGW
jgi:hypothetical protein